MDGVTLKDYRPQPPERKREIKRGTCRNVEEKVLCDVHTVFSLGLFWAFAAMGGKHQLAHQTHQLFLKNHVQVSC